MSIQGNKPSFSPEELGRVYLRIIDTKFESSLDASEHLVIGRFTRVTTVQNVLLGFLVQDLQNSLIPRNLENDTCLTKPNFDKAKLQSVM